MTEREAIEVLSSVHVYAGAKCQNAIALAIEALEKQEQSCDTCRHGRFGSEACINCRVGFPNHYEAEEEA